MSTYKYNEIMKVINNGSRPFLVYQISKEEVIERDMSGLDRFFKIVTRVGEPVRQSVSISCSGYDDVPTELYDIPEVRVFIQKAFKRFPYLLYYISIETESEKWLLSSVADEVLSVKESNANMTFDDGIPTVLAKLTFKNDSLEDILKPIITHGKKLNDIENAKDIAVEYAMRFDHWEKTLDRLGLKW